MYYINGSSNIESSLQLWKKSHLLMAYYFLNMLLNPFTNILFGTLASILKIIAFSNFFLNSIRFYINIIPSSLVLEQFLSSLILWKNIWSFWMIVKSSRLGSFLHAHSLIIFSRKIGLLFSSFSIMVYPRRLDTIPYAIQWDLAVSILNVIVCIY